MGLGAVYTHMGARGLIDRPMFVVMTDVHMSARHMCTLHTRGWVGEIRCTPSVLRVEDEEEPPGRSINNVSGKGCKKESGLCVLRPGTHSLTQKRDMRRDSRT